MFRNGAETVPEGEKEGKSPQAFGLLNREIFFAKYKDSCDIQRRRTNQ